MSDKTEQTPDETDKTSAWKRDITATVASTAVTMLLGLVASAVIEQVGNRVKDAVAKKSKSETE